MPDAVLRSLDFNHFASGVHKITFAELASHPDAVFLDVRSKEEQAAMLISPEEVGVRSLVIPINELPDRMGEIPSDRLIGVFCPTVVRSSIVYAHLLTHGYERVRIVDGGYSGITSTLLPGRLRALQETARA